MALTFVLGAGCSGQGLALVDPSAGDNPSNGADGGAGGGGGGTSGLPCDVQDLVTQECIACHGSTPSGGAPMSLVSRTDFLSHNASGQTYGQASVDRMKNTGNPMPPTGVLSASEIATLENWVQAGMPAGTCGAVSDPFSAAPTCTSGATWTRGDDGRPTMKPGQACIACHASSGEQEAAIFAVAGTLYPTAHEPDDCNGASPSSGLKVVITDANGKTFTLTPNAAGNFYSLALIATPYKAKVVDASGKERAMVAAQTDGDCNGCHTQSGDNGAPGRIIPP